MRKHAEILAVVTADPKKVWTSSGPPVFCVERESLEEFSLLLCRSTGAMVHELDEDLRIIAVHG